MNRMFRLYTLAALALVMAACSREDIIADIPAPEEGIPFSATITSDSQATRTTLKEETDGSISVKWNSSDRVAMVYEVGGVTVVTEATVTPKDDDSGEATITAFLNANVTGGTAVTLIYPYSAVDTRTGNVLDDYLSMQECTLKGTTESIAAKYDLRQGTGTITLATGDATLSSNVTMKSQVCIWKITLGVAIDGVGQGGYPVGDTIYLDYDGRTYTLKIRDDLMGGSPVYRRFKGADVIYVALLPATKAPLTATSTAYNGDIFGYLKSKVTLVAGNYYQSLMTLNKAKVLTTGSLGVALNNGDILTGTGGDATHVTIADGATVMLYDVTIPGFVSTYTDLYPWAGITCLGSAAITLVGTNVVKGYSPNYPGIQAGPAGTTLTIRGSGRLAATSGKSSSQGKGAGIGGGNNMSVGNILIEGGVIVARANYGGAGIGSGYADEGSTGSCGDITISGGMVDTSSDNFGAGIGGSTRTICGNILINGGDVTAKGGHYAAGIGCGYSGDCGTITITDGVTSVSAKKSDSEPGPYSIGLSTSCMCGAISIGGTVYYDGLHFDNGGEAYLATSSLRYYP